MTTLRARLIAPIVAPLALVLCLVAGAGTAQTIPGLPGGGAAQEQTAPEGDVPAAQLLSILTDEAARAALIADLERLVAEQQAEAPGDDAEETTLGRRIAETTRTLATQAGEAISRAARLIAGAPSRLTAIGDRDLDVFLDALAELAGTIAITVALFLGLRRLVMPLYRGLGARTRHRHWTVRVRAGVLATLVDVATVGLAAILGYAMAYAVIGTGEITLRQTFYLNAFVAVELVKAGIRVILSPATADLRPLPIGDRGARRLWQHARLVVSVLGYTQLVVVPIVNVEGTRAAGAAMSLLAALVVIGYLAILVLRHRDEVAAWLVARAPAPVSPADPPAQGALDFGDAAPAAPRGPRHRVFRAWLLRRWYWAALTYLALMAVLVLTGRDGSVLDSALWASLRVAVIIALAGWIGTALAYRARKGIPVPPALAEALPTLGHRIEGAFVPFSWILRGLLVLLVGLVVLDAVSLIDAEAWIDSPAGRRSIGTLVTVFLVLGVVWLIWIVLASWIDQRLDPEGAHMASPREQTLLALLRNAALIVLVLLAAMFALAELGLNIGPLIASAGVVGLAIGFGAQKLVQDIITGVFIQFENAINVGDVVTAGGITGAVERLTVRSVSLRDLNGIYHTLPFSSVDSVSNFTRGFSYWVLDLGVAYKEDVAEAKRAMFDAFAELRADPEIGPFILDELDWFGLDAFGDSAVILKCRIRTVAGKQWVVGRAFNEAIKRVFDARGIEIPFPHRTIYYGQSQAVEAARSELESGTGHALRG